MAFKAECTWARVCIRKTKEFCSRLRNAPDEGSAKFGARVQKDKLYSEYFKGYPQFTLASVISTVSAR